MRRYLLAATLTAVAVTAGCGGAVDTTKVTYQRTTVPAGQANASGRAGDGEPRSNDPAFTMDKLRTLDPCGLLTKDLLANVGTPADNNRSDFSECANFMADPDGEDLSITLTLGDSAGAAADAEQNIGGLPAMENELDSGDACFVTVVTSTSPNFGISIQAGGNGKDLCAAGRTVMTGVIDKIRADAPVYAVAKGTLLEHDPCTILDEAALKPALGDDFDSSPYNLHWCNWNSTTASVGLWFRLGYDPAAAGSSGTPVDLGKGVTGYQQATKNEVASCEIEWAHKPFAGEDTEIVEVFYDNPKPKAGEDPCRGTQALAKTLVDTLPKD